MEKIKKALSEAESALAEISHLQKGPQHRAQIAIVEMMKAWVEFAEATPPATA